MMDCASEQRPGDLGRRERRKYHRQAIANAPTVKTLVFLIYLICWSQDHVCTRSHSCPFVVGNISSSFFAQSRKIQNNATSPGCTAVGRLSTERQGSLQVCFVLPHGIGQWYPSCFTARYAWQRLPLRICRTWNSQKGYQLRYDETRRKGNSVQTNLHVSCGLRLPSPLFVMRRPVPVQTRSTALQGLSPTSAWRERYTRALPEQLLWMTTSSRFELPAEPVDDSFSLAHAPPQDVTYDPRSITVRRVDRESSISQNGEHDHKSPPGKEGTAKTCDYSGEATIRFGSMELKNGEPKINEADLDERFIKGSGKGGQKINKTSSMVQLIHHPTGIVVRCQATR
eukprot:GHVT01087730.1.p1 GENE.GHVT01087730.1~~GHVT01087730.1.p1  ORF type:complete len:341 (-),score=7.00 GHVT01087730.1:854-1876(-)